jgi:activator of Hsp90 ATPase-like protein
MTNSDFTTAFTVDQSPEEVFAAINNSRAWWTGEFEGSADKLGAEFTYEYRPHHYSKQKVIEFISGKKVVWLVSESQLNFLMDKSEWDGTKITFDIEKTNGKTEVRFTHVGLKPEIECYGACSNAWASLVGKSLRSFITTGVAEKTTF